MIAETSLGVELEDFEDAGAAGEADGPDVVVETLCAGGRGMRGFLGSLGAGGGGRYRGFAGTFPAPGTPVGRRRRDGFGVAD